MLQKKIKNWELLLFLNKTDNQVHICFKKTQGTMVTEIITKPYLRLGDTPIYVQVYRGEGELTK